jgi:hypothetical protein
MFIKTVQAVSGLCFSLFSTLHVGGHFLANFSFPLANAALFGNRELFHNPYFELGIIGGSLIVHSISSYLLVWNRKPTMSASATLPILRLQQQEKSIHRYSGYVLSLLMFVHVSFTRLFPLYFLEDADIVDLTLVTESFHQKIMYGYYIILGSAGLYHTFYGIVQSLNHLNLLRYKPKAGTWTKLGVGFVLIMIPTTLALAGFFEEIPIPLQHEYDHIHSQLLQITGLSRFV